MKKDGILKAIGIVFLVYVLVSWLIPVGYFKNGSFIAGEVSPVGIIDLIRYPIINLTSSVFILMAICILFTGGLYSVLNKTGVYSKWIDNIVKKYKDNGNKFLIITVLIFSILTSLTALTLPLFVLVPMFVTVILLLGYSKIIALLSTVGAILVGNLASTYGFNVYGYLSYFYETDINSTIMYRIILFVLVVGALLMVILKLTEKRVESVKAEEIEIPFYEKNKSKTKVNSTPMVIILVLTIVLTLVGMYNWKYGLNIDLFDNIHSSITEFEVNGYPIFANLIGSINALGYWSNYELALLLVLSSIVIGLVYKVKFEDIITSFIDGCKKMLPVAIYVIFACLILLLMSSNNAGTMFGTIVNYVVTNFEKLGGFSIGIITVIGSLFYNDFPYMIDIIYQQIVANFSDLGLVSFIQQTIHGLLMLVLPTSTILVAGLKYLNISYKEWLSNIWKYLLIAFIIIMSIILLIAFV